MHRQLRQKQTMDTSPTPTTPALKSNEETLKRPNFGLWLGASVPTYRLDRETDARLAAVDKFHRKLFTIEDKILLWLFGLFVHRGLRPEVGSFPCQTADGRDN